MITDGLMQYITEGYSADPGVPAITSSYLSPGNFRIWAFADSGQVGSYTLKVTAPTPCGTATITGVVAVDLAVSGALTAASCILPNGLPAQGWSFSLATESPVGFDVVSSGFTPWIAVTDVSLNLLFVGFPSNETGASLATRIPAGDYQVWVTSIDDRIGSFTLNRTVAVIASCDTPVGTVAIGQVVNGVIATTDCLLPSGRNADPWTLTVATATTLLIDYRSTDFDAFLTVLDAGGLVFAENDDSDGSLNSRISQAFPAGTYTVLATTYNPGATGSYSLSVQPAAGGAAGVQADERRALKAPANPPRWEDSRRIRVPDPR